MSELNPACLADWLAVLGTEGLRTGDAIPTESHTDWSGCQPTRPLAYLRPANTAQVAAALRTGHAHRVPVVPQGGRTGLAGGATPTPGSVVLSLERLNTIEPVDTAARTVSVPDSASTLTLLLVAFVGMFLGKRRRC